MNISWWFRESDKSKLLPLPDGTTVNKMGSKLSLLFIESTSSYLVGYYVCIVVNRAGTSEYTSKLNIHGKIIVIPCKLAHTCLWMNVVTFLVFPQFEVITNQVNPLSYPKDLSKLY